MKRMNQLLSTLLVGFVLLLAMSAIGCTSETHHSIAEIKSQGWPAHQVSIDVARISSFGGGISYSQTTQQYAFLIYDKTATYTGGTAFEDIIVVVKQNNINFTPKEGDFIRLKGELQASDIGDPKRGWKYTQKAMMIYATNIEQISPPDGW